MGVQDEEREDLLPRQVTAGAESISLDSLDGRSSGSGSASGFSGKQRSWLAQLWRNYDSNFMKPLLTSSRPSLVETLPDCCSPCAHFLTSDEQLGMSVPLTDNEAYALSDVDGAACVRSLSTGD